MLRMYVDEVGNADLKASSDPNHRYLSLTGVVFDLDYVDRVLAPEMEALKRRYFRAHVDEPLILHRKELVNKKYPFQALRDPETVAALRPKKQKAGPKDRLSPKASNLPPPGVSPGLRAS